VYRDCPQQGTSQKPGRDRDGVVPELGGQPPGHVGPFGDDPGQEDVLEMDEWVLEGVRKDPIDS